MKTPRRKTEESFTMVLHLRMPAVRSACYAAEQAVRDAYYSVPVRISAICFATLAKDVEPADCLASMQLRTAILS